MQVDWLNCPRTGLKYNVIRTNFGALCGTTPRQALLQLNCHPDGLTNISYINESPTCNVSALI